MNPVSWLKKKAAGAAIDIGVPMVLKEINRRLSSGEEGEDAMNAWNKLIKFMNGKKTWTGFALIALPAVVGALATAAQQAGVDPVIVAKITVWGTGGVLAAVGLAHKVVKWLDDLTPDQN